MEFIRLYSAVWGILLHHARRELQFPQTNMQKMIQCYLKFYAYIIQIVQAVGLND